MKRLTYSFIALATTATMAYADLPIATGKVGGGYDARAQEISERLRQRGIENTVTNYNGSDEITLSLCQGKADIGITQIDAIFARAKEGCSLKPIANYGEEVAVLLFPPDSEHSKLKHLTASDTIMVDTIGSGSELWWNTAVSIEMGEDGSKDDWAKASVNNDPLELAFAGGSFGTVDGVVMVRKPNSPDIKRLLDAGWSFGELWDKNLDDLKFNGKPLYASDKLKVKDSGAKTHTGYVYKVSSFIVASDRIQKDRTSFGTIVNAVQ